MQKTDNSQSPHQKPCIQVGCTLLSDTSHHAYQDIAEQSVSLLKKHLSRQFPQFEWKFTLLKRHRFPPHGPLDPLELLESGLQEKIRFHWDYCLVLVSNELIARYRISTLGVPSSAFEVAVASCADLNGTHNSEQLTALFLHLLGHIWGADHWPKGPMEPPEHLSQLTIEDFPHEQCQDIAKRLGEAADLRLEEENKKRGKFSFYWKTFRSDPKGILKDIWGYAPWQLPLKMSRMTAATAVTMLFLLLGAESWDLGVHASSPLLGIGTFSAVFGATVFIFAGQNLGQLSRILELREQLIRTRLVTFITLLLGICSLWLVLFCLIFVIGISLPQQVILHWLGENKLDYLQLAHYAAFMAILGTLAGAMGGNLEEEDELKADLFYDEET